MNKQHSILFSSPYCPAGQQYVYMPPTLDGDAVASICPLNNPIHPLCRCQTGVFVYKDLFNIYYCDRIFLRSINILHGFYITICLFLVGCRHKNFFIPYGTSVMVDKCGNKCYCNSLNGEVGFQWTPMLITNQLGNKWIIYISVDCPFYVLQVECEFDSC